jgi:hypothetical protein
MSEPHMSRRASADAQPRRSLHDHRAIYLNGVEYRQRSLVGLPRIDRTSSGHIPVSLKLTITCPDAPFTQITPRQFAIRAPYR